MTQWVFNLDRLNDLEGLLNATTLFAGKPKVFCSSNIESHFKHYIDWPSPSWVFDQPWFESSCPQVPRQQQQCSSPGFVIYLEGLRNKFQPPNRSKEGNGSILSKYKARSRGRGRSIGFQGEREREREWRAEERERKLERSFGRIEGLCV
jgi:hypothetical protein